MTDATPSSRRRSARAVRVLLWIAAVGAMSFMAGRYGRDMLDGRAEAADGRTRLLSRAALPQGQLSYPTGAIRTSVAAALPPDVADDPAWLAALQQVRPACAIVGSGSGVCINARGDILTNAHVALELGRPTYVQFADGGRVVAACFAINHKLDLALLGVRGEHVFAHATLAARPAAAHTLVLCIGNPSQYHPDGRPSPYAAFHVSLGRIVAHDADRLGDQSLGRTRHDAWTYWGHSGAPLVNSSGHIVALHNSWEADAGTRHAVTQEAIVRFLREAGVPFTVQP